MKLPEPSQCEPDLLCQHCGLAAQDARATLEERDGDWWVYCRSCDAWTAHPAPSPLAPRTPRPA